MTSLAYANLRHVAATYMQSLFGIHVRLRGIFRVFVGAKAMINTVHTNFCEKRAVLRFMNATISSYRVFLNAINILNVYHLRHVPKVSNSIVGANSVDMVNNPIGPFPIHIQPSEAMCLIGIAPNANGEIAARGNGSHRGSRIYPCNLLDADEYARLRVVTKMLLERSGVDVKADFCHNAEHNLAYAQAQESAYNDGFSGIPPMSESVEYVSAYVSGASDAARFFLFSR